MGSIFLVCFDNYHLVFSMKYWTLSLKVESLMKRDEKISSRQNRIINVLFWTFEGLILVSVGLIMANMYDAHNRRYLDIVGCVGVTIPIFVSLAFVSIAFLKLKKCLQHDKLAISINQIILYVGSFFIATLAVTSFMIFLFFIDDSDPSKLTTS
jgi:hypothetical protein